MGRVTKVFYGADALPYKDKNRQVHFPIAGTGFLGASNTTQIKFYYDELDNLDETTWVAVSKLPNGKIGSRVLESHTDSELNEHYALLELDSYYTQYKGDVFISLQGYQGGVNLDYNEETSQYEIHGTPTIAATGSIKFAINYANQFVGSGETDNINFQRILAALGTKLGMRAYSEHVEELPSEGSPDVFYVVNDDLNDPNKANIYVWNGTTKHYIWVGDNTLDLGEYYTKEQGEQFESDVDNRVTSVENELSSVASGSPKGVYATLSDLESAYPTGTDGIYVVDEDGHWYFWNGAAWTDGGIYQAAEGYENIENALKKANIYPKNLFTTVGLVDGKYINWTNGNLEDNSDFYSSDYLPVSGSTSYSLYKIYCYAFFDSSKQLISGAAISYNLTDVVSPANAAYIVVSSDYTKAPSNILVCLTSNVNLPVYIKNLDLSDFILGTTGNSETKTMSQKATTKELEKAGAVPSLLVNTNVISQNNAVYGRYINWNNGDTEGGEDYCSTDFCPIEPATEYTTKDILSYAFYDESKTFISGGLWNYQKVTFTTPSNARYIRVSPLAVKGIGTLVLCRSSYYDSKVKIHNLDLSAVEQKLFGKGFMSAAGNMPQGTTLSIGYPTSIKKNTNISFFGNVTNLSELIISIGTTESNASYITLTDTQCHIINKKLDGTYDIQSFTHGLTIADFLYVHVQGKQGTADITLTSSNGSYKIENTMWWGDGDNQLRARASNCNLTNCKLIYSSKDLFSKVHAYGDSYFQYSLNSMWTYYLLENGYTNPLLNGFPGETSDTAYQQFLTNVAMNVPQYAIWCMGMNDGDTDDSTVSPRWKTNYDNFIAKCNELGITPILATIPTTPVVNNNAKNTIVKASGYRYIDFEKAVGANSSGVWYSGMLSGDNVHPTVLGAKALFEQAILDAPELTF